MLDAIGTGVTKIIQWMGTVVTALTYSSSSGNGALYSLLPVIGLAIGMAVIGFAIATIKSLTYGFK